MLGFRLSAVKFFPAGIVSFVVGFAAFLPLTFSAAHAQQCKCNRMISADVVSLDQAFYNNRLGSFQAGGMIFALRDDVVSNQSTNPDLEAGSVMLRKDKRARPLVLRMNVGDCLDVRFENLLADVPSVSKMPFPQNTPNVYAPGQATDNQWEVNNQVGQADRQPMTREAGLNVAGLELCSPATDQPGISSDASWVGANKSSLECPSNPSGGPSSCLVGPGKEITYRYYAKAEGTFLATSTGANVGNFGGQLMQGMFGAVNVQPEGAEWYRSQVSAADMTLASVGSTSMNHPMLDYDAVYSSGDLKGRPILKMLNDDNQIVHSDLTAIITGPNRGAFPGEEPPFNKNPAYPERQMPYREISILYHDDFVSRQAFKAFEDKSKPIQHTLSAGTDTFAINYGMAAIGPPIWANRIGVGPQENCAACRYEEFFLSSWPLGDPAMIVDVPANSIIDTLDNIDKAVDPGNCQATDSASDRPMDECVEAGPKATIAYFPDDPSNVYHSYMGDHTKYRILHAGTNISHVHHQHAHQWLHSPNSPNSNYRDSQMITPGSAFTLEYVYNGSGNKNQTVGDSIFHCHFYPHFAQGMWALWRVHDTFESGTQLDSSGRPDQTAWNRALPDGEIVKGVPTPAIVPVPMMGMAPEPARVRVCPVYDPKTASQARVGMTCPAAPSADAEPVGQVVMVNEDDINEGKNPGYPFYIPGVAGQRAPHPPLDFACEDGVDFVETKVGAEKTIPVPVCKNGKEYDGGLPRHVVLAENGTIYEKHNRWDFTKYNEKLEAIELPEQGTKAELVAMMANAQRDHPTVTPSGDKANFVLNGQPPQQGAPYADPYITLDGQPVQGGQKRTYKAANIQLDVVLNKKGWHYPQQRILALWGDVKDTLEGKRRPEPFFFRANSLDLVEYWHTNLMPNYYDLDDFQVRTPTDVLGQHIHLVKFDVTASDGAANGYNYEDGTFSPQEVQELVEDINENGGLYDPEGMSQQNLAVKPIPFFGKGPASNEAMASPTWGKKKEPHHQWEGAQVTVQRWYADPLCNEREVSYPTHELNPCKVDPGIPTEDRTIRTVFTHDHFGPSTHQQVGLYAGLVIEPFGSTWLTVDGKPMGDRDAAPYDPQGPSMRDGGPTSWQALIKTPNETDSYREFMIEMQDKQLAYTGDSRSSAKAYKTYGCEDCDIKENDPGGPWGWSDNGHAIRAPSDSKAGAPNPFLVSRVAANGTWSMNYNNEPLPFRVAKGTARQTDLGNVFYSITRGDAALNKQPTPDDPGGIGTSGFKFPPPQPGAQANDPYTPLLRAYPGENIQIRSLVGAHMLPHYFNIHGMNWLFEPAWKNSGYRNTQGMGISEYYDMIFTAPLTASADRETADYLYMPSSNVDGLTDGNWGLFRTYNTEQENMPALPTAQLAQQVDVCPANANVRSFELAAVYAGKTSTDGTYDLLGGPLVYNARGQAGSVKDKLFDTNAMMYVHLSDLDADGNLKAGVPREPLILRASAGECIDVTVTNKLPDVPLNLGENLTTPFTDKAGTKITLQTSKKIGLHAGLLTYNIIEGDGVNVGLNPEGSTADIGQKVNHRWYAGNIEYNEDGSYNRHVPVEFGSIPLTPADPLMQHNYGLVGAIIIEPEGAKWEPDVNSRASARVNTDDGEFREFVLILQDDLAAIRMGEIKDGQPTNLINGGNFTTTAVNYRTEPLWLRYPGGSENNNYQNNKSIAQALANSQVIGDPETPVFAARAGQPVRLRLIHPSGLTDQSMTLHGHVWQELPYQDDSTKIGDNPLSQWIGTRVSFGPNSSFEVVLPSAGGEGKTPGDYLYRSFVGNDFNSGIWGVMRVGDADESADIVTIIDFSKTRIAGTNTVNPDTGKMAETVLITNDLGEMKRPVDPMTGQWEWVPPEGEEFSPNGLEVHSSLGGTANADGFTTGPIFPAAKDTGFEAKAVSEALQAPVRASRSVEDFRGTVRRIP